MVKDIARCDTIEKRLLTTFFLLLVAGVLLYGYLVNLTVVHVVERKTIEQDIATLSSDVSDLELSYMDLKSAVTLEYAYEHGFYDIVQVTYVKRGQFALRTNTDL